MVRLLVILHNLLGGPLYEYVQIFCPSWSCSWSVHRDSIDLLQGHIPVCKRLKCNTVGMKSNYDNSRNKRNSWKKRKKRLKLLILRRRVCLFRFATNGKRETWASSGRCSKKSFGIEINKQDISRCIYGVTRSIDLILLDETLLQLNITSTDPSNIVEYFLSQDTYGVFLFTTWVTTIVNIRLEMWHTDNDDDDNNYDQADEETPPPLPSCSSGKTSRSRHLYQALL